MSSHRDEKQSEEIKIEYNPRPTIVPIRFDMSTNTLNELGKRTEEGRGDYDDSPAPAPYRQGVTIANPGPAALFSFASTTFLVSLYNVHARGVETGNMILGMAVFAGGLVQFIVGVFELVRNNVFGATAWLSYGSFWLSYATILMPGSGVIASYPDPKEFNNALGLYLMVWFIVTVLFVIPVLRKSMVYTALLSGLALVFLLESIAGLTSMPSVTKAAGALGLVVGSLGYYIGLSELMADEATAIVNLPTP